MDDHVGDEPVRTPAVACSPGTDGSRGFLADDRLFEGQRIGRYVIMGDVNGQRHAVAAGSVAALGETDDGVLVLLPGGRMIHVPRPLHEVVRWLGG